MNTFPNVDLPAPGSKQSNMQGKQLLINAGAIESIARASTAKLRPSSGKVKIGSGPSAVGKIDRLQESESNACLQVGE